MSRAWMRSGFRSRIQRELPLASRVSTHMLPRRLRLLGHASLALGALPTLSCSLIAAPSSPRFAAAHDGVASATDLPSKEWLLAQPRGAYTTARTCAGASRLFEWDTHVQRTADSAAAMLADEVADGAAACEDGLRAQVGRAELLRPRLDETVGAAVRAYLAARGGAELPAEELKVTVLVSWSPEEAAAKAGGGGGAAGSIACHVAPLPPIPSPPVRVEVRGAPRQNAAAKDSSWVTERAPLEALMRSAWAAVNELLLASEEGELLEGSQTK